MATIVPVSHSQRWRTRSRNRSSDFQHSSTYAASNDGSSDSEFGWEEEPSDDDEEDDMYDNVTSSPWLVVPQAYVSCLSRQVVLSPRVKQGMIGIVANPDHAYKKAMEKRRANGLLVVPMH